MADPLERRLRPAYEFWGAGASAIGAGFAWTIEWPFEKAIWRFHIGDFRGARAAVTSIGEDVPERWRETWQRFRQELDAAVEIAPLAEDWDAARAGIEANAWARGIEVLRSRGASAAAPWFSLASQVDTSVLCGAILDYCRATDDARREQAKAVVRRVGVPPGLEAVFAD